MAKKIMTTLKKLKGRDTVMKKESKFDNVFNNLKVEIERVNDSKDKIRKRIEELKAQRRMINSSNGITLVGFDIEKIENDNQACNLTDINSKIEKLELALKQNIFNDEKLRLAAREYIESIESAISDLDDKIKRNTDEVEELIKTTEQRKEEIERENHDLTIEIEELLFPLGESVFSYNSNYTGSYKIHKLKEKVKG